MLEAIAVAALLSLGSGIALVLRGPQIGFLTETLAILTVAPVMFIILMAVFL